MDLSKLIMEYKGCYAIVKIDAEDQIFVGEVFGIADSLSFHGTSVEELEEMFHQSVDSYFDACRHFGKEPERWELI